MVAEPGNEDLRDLAQRIVQLQRARQPLADPLEQAEPVRLALRIAPPGLGDEHHDAVDLARRVAQRHREFPDEQEAAVAPVPAEGVLPGQPAEHLAGYLLGAAGLAVGKQPEGAERLADKGSGRSVQPQ